MKTIYKYTLTPAERTVKTPFRSQFICAHEQLGSICVWAEVDTSETATEEHTFEIFCTGHEMPEGNRRYLGSVFMDNGFYVFHVYEEQEESHK